MRGFTDCVAVLATRNTSRIEGSVSAVARRTTAFACSVCAAAPATSGLPRGKMRRAPSVCAKYTASMTRAVGTAKPPRMFGFSSASVDSAEASALANDASESAAACASALRENAATSSRTEVMVGGAGRGVGGQNANFGFSAVKHTNRTHLRQREPLERRVLVLPAPR